MNPYFTAPDTEKFRFYRIPKLLFTDERYRPVSTDAKMLYGLLLDRLSLSEKNGWKDERRRQGQGRANRIYLKEFTQKADFRNPRSPGIGRK